MRPISHAITSIGVAALIYLWFGSLTASVVCVLSGIFFDLDHVPEYLDVRRKKFNLLYRNFNISQVEKFRYNCRGFGGLQTISQGVTAERQRGEAPMDKIVRERKRTSILKDFYYSDIASQKEKVYIVFHSLELILLLWFAITFYKLNLFWITLAISISTHLIFDLFSNPLATPYAYFLTYRIAKGFRVRHLFNIRASQKCRP